MEDIRTCIYITGRIPSYKLFPLFDTNYKRLFLSEQYSDSIIKALLKKLFQGYISDILITDIQMNRINEYENCLLTIWKNINQDIFFIRNNRKQNFNSYKEFKELKENDYLYIDGLLSKFNTIVNNLNTNVTFNVVFFINKRINDIESVHRKENEMKNIYDSKYIKYMKPLVRRLEHILNYIGIEIIDYKIGLPYNWRILRNLIREGSLTHKTTNEKGIFIKKLEANIDVNRLINMPL